jgi:hypothetical protein
MAAVCCLLGSIGAQPLPKFMGRQVTIVEPELDADGFFPKGPASVCLQGPPKRQCYNAPKDYGKNPTVEVVELKKGLPALLFSAASGGVSGFGLHYALLDAAFENLLPADLTLSNQNLYALWNEPSISDALIFLTADYVWGPDESHYDKPRYIVSAYVLKHTSLVVDDLSFYLEDRYMTVDKYDPEKADILDPEKPEILSRLRRVKAAH